MFFKFINSDVSESPEICWKAECLVYGFLVEECYSSDSIKTFESFHEEAIRFADELSSRNEEGAEVLKNGIDWLNVFNSYTCFMETENDLSPEHYFCCDKDKVVKWMKEMKAHP